MLLSLNPSGRIDDLGEQRGLLTPLLMAPILLLLLWKSGCDHGNSLGRSPLSLPSRYLWEQTVDLRTSDYLETASCSIEKCRPKRRKSKVLQGKKPLTGQLGQRPKVSVIHHQQGQGALSPARGLVRKGEVQSNTGERRKRKENRGESIWNKRWEK